MNSDKPYRWSDNVEEVPVNEDDLDEAEEWLDWYFGPDLRCEEVRQAGVYAIN